MKRTICAVALGVLPMAALAGGGHGAAHDMKGMDHDMQETSHDVHHGGIGQPGNPDQASRTIGIVMSDDMRFAPDRIKVKAGETVRFFLRNAGKVEHEMVIGTLAELKEHAEMMRTQQTMSHAEPNSASVAPGRRGGIVWQFTRAGTVDFACLRPGHFEAGMKGVIEVE